MYQTLKTYDSSLTSQPKIQFPDEYANDGIEYDYEIDDGMVVGSPGGVSTTYHHYTHGLYGRGNTSSDVYAGQGDRYINGEYGNVYNVGQSSPNQLQMFTSPPDNRYWENITPAQTGPYGQEFAPPTTYPGNAFSEVRFRENYDPRMGVSVYPPPPHKPSTIEHLDPSMELLVDPKTILPPPKKLAEEVKDVASRVRIVPKTNPLLMLFLFLAVFVVFDFWSATASLYIKQAYHNNNEPSWKSSLMYAVIITVVFVVLLWITDIPLVEFESI